MFTQVTMLSWELFPLTTEEFTESVHLSKFSCNHQKSHLQPYLKARQAEILHKVLRSYLYMRYVWYDIEAVKRTKHLHGRSVSNQNQNIIL